jgi:hypothetical protein
MYRQMQKRTHNNLDWSSLSSFSSFLRVMDSIQDNGNFEQGCLQKNYVSFLDSSAHMLFIIQKKSRVIFIQRKTVVELGENHRSLTKISSFISVKNVLPLTP